MKAKAEDIERIKTSVRSGKEQGEIHALYVAIGAITVYAGSPMERSFTESQIKEIFKAAISV